MYINNNLKHGILICTLNRFKATFQKGNPNQPFNSTSPQIAYQVSLNLDLVHRAANIKSATEMTEPNVVIKWNGGKELNCFQRIAMDFVKLGPIPKHVGFIMDGNRRFARKLNAPVIDGHYIGFEKLIDCYYLGRSFGVTEITMYAFSIENFKRPKDEVDGLWNLLEEKLQRCRKDIPQLKKLKATIKVIGNVKLVPQRIQDTVEDLRKEVGEIENPEFTCYLAVAYTSRDEITRSMKKILTNVKEGASFADQIDGKLVDQNLYTSDYKNPVDLIIRTSGETRLSDFLLWQSSDALLYFTDTLWPEFTFFDLLKAFCAYQKFYFDKRGK